MPVLLSYYFAAGAASAFAVVGGALRLQTRCAVVGKGKEGRTKELWGCRSGSMRQIGEK